MQQYEIMREVMDTIFKAFEPKDHSFTIIKYAVCEQYSGDITEEFSIRFEIIGEFGGYYWQHHEFGMEPQIGDVCETALECYNDAIAYTERYAKERGAEMQDIYDAYRLRGNK